MEYLSPERLMNYRLSFSMRACRHLRPLKLSPYVFFFQKGSLSMLYHSLSMKVVAGGANLRRFYSQCSLNNGVVSVDIDEAYEAILPPLMDQSFLIDLNSDDDELLPILRQRELEHERKPSTLRLVPAAACNIRCRYCSHDLNRAEFMNVEEGKKAIALFFESCDKTGDLRIIISGYEPLLNWEVLLHLLAFGRKRAGEARAGNLRIVLQTNGILLDEKKAAILRDLDISVQIALDGREKEHDSARMTPQGNGTFADVLHGYRILSQYGVMPSIRCRIGLHNISSLMEIVHFFTEALECREIELSFVKGSELAVPSGIAMEKAVQAYQFMRRYGVKEQSIMRRLRAFVQGRPVLYCCMYGPAQMVALPGHMGSGCDALLLDGGSRSCEDSTSLIQQAGYGSAIISEPDSGREKKRTAPCPLSSPYSSRHCRRCPALTLCGGVCSCHESSTSALEQREACIHSQTVLQWILDDLAAQILPQERDGGFFFMPCGGDFRNP
ncbi:MAG: radical SAM protein [Candidatus Xenobiia bacterium LiM19]